MSKRPSIKSTTFLLWIQSMFLSSKINTSPCGAEWHQLIPVGFVIKQNPETTNQSEASATPWHCFPLAKKGIKINKGRAGILALAPTQTWWHREEKIEHQIFRKGRRYSIISERGVITVLYFSVYFRINQHAQHRKTGTWIKTWLKFLFKHKLQWRIQRN